jgi:hypothetical protein
MDDFLFLGEAVPSPILDKQASGSKAPTAAIALAGLNWIKAAAVRSGGAPVKRYGPPAALTACLLGLAWVGWPNVQRSTPTLPSAEINPPAQKPAEESHPQRAEGGAMRAAQSLSTGEVSALETAIPTLEAAKNEAAPRIVEAAGKTSPPLPPKPVERPANGSERVDRIGLKIAALLALDPVVDHSVSATLARRREQRARHDAFDPSQHPNAPGAPRPLGTIRPTAPANKESANYAYRQPAN